MTIEEIGALANICRQLRELSQRYSTGSGPDARQEKELVLNIYKDYRAIFIEACETNRERIKHFLKK